MDKIYSRKRIKIPKIQNFQQNNKATKLFKIIAILGIAIITLYMTTRAISPLFDNLCSQKAMNIAINVMNDKTREILKKYNYENVIKITKNEKDNTNIINTNVEVLNQIINDLQTSMNKEIQALENEKIEIPIGAFTGSKYFMAMGPKMNVKIIPGGHVVCEVRKEFESKGINQTIYRIYLETKGDLYIITPYSKIARELNQSVLLVETVIVGEVPQVYLNMDK